MSEKEWIEIGRVVGETGPKGDTGDIGIGTIIKGHYNNYSEFITVHPSGRIGDAYIVDGSYYYWNENGWANVGSVRGEKGDTGASVTIKGSYDSYNDLIREHPTGMFGMEIPGLMLVRLRVKKVILVLRETLELLVLKVTVAFHQPLMLIIKQERL